MKLSTPRAVATIYPVEATITSPARRLASAVEQSILAAQRTRTQVVGVVITTWHDEPGDGDMLAWLLNGRRPKYRRQTGQQDYLRSRTPVSDPSQLDSYERLFYDLDPSLCKEELSLRVFYWSEVFSYREAAAWLAVGADYHDFDVCVALRRAGVTPSLANRPYLRHHRPTGLNIFRAVATGAASLHGMAAWASKVTAAQRRTQRVAQ